MDAQLGREGQRGDFRDRPPARTWWGRNWKWVVPVGCLTPLLACGGAIVLTVLLVFSTIRSSDVSREAVARAKADGDVQALLGTPIEEGFSVSGSLEVSGPSGSAELSIPLSGPKGSATLYVVATKSAGRWEFSTLQVAPRAAAARVDLLSKSD